MEERYKYLVIVYKAACYKWIRKDINTHGVIIQPKYLIKTYLLFLYLFSFPLLFAKYPHVELSII